MQICTYVEIMLTYIFQIWTYTFNSFYENEKLYEMTVQEVG